MRLTLQRKYHLAGNIWSYVFAPAEPTIWTAGQFIRVELPHPNPDTEGTKRFFTIASPPHEHSICITTRITSSSFKQALHCLAPGETIIMLDPPAGDFIWREDAPPPLVFVTQGIGITPFYAMIADRIHRQLPIPAALFWTNRTAEIPFKREFATWTAQNPAFTVTHSSEPFTPTRLAELVPNLSARLIYVSSPISLVSLLGPPTNLPASRLKQDFFPNYSQTDY